MERRTRRWLWIVGTVLVVGAAVAVPTYFSARSASSAQPAGTVPDPAADHFNFVTLPPGAQLPSGAQCAQMVRGSPIAEIRPGNQAYNRTVGQPVGPALLPKGDSARAALLASRINGDFTGTTQQILLWAACKWGINQNVVFAQAAAESSWQQGHLDDWGTDASRCPPGHGLGADGRAGECPQSYGILQTKYHVWAAAWPGIATSTAMNVDVAYAIWRSCFNGDEIWLTNRAPLSQPYQAGDLWGCVGRWYAGAWYTPAADRYISRVKKLLRERVWDEAAFIKAG